MERCHHYLLAITFTVGIGSAAFIGCQQAAPPASDRAIAKDAAGSKISAADYWDVMFIQGNKMGYAHTTIKPIEEEGRQLVKITSENSFTMTRYGEKTTQSFEFTSLETPAGEPLRMSVKTALGPTLAETTGKVNSTKGTLELVTTAGDKSIASELKWPAGCRGFFGGEQSLRERPMVAGEHREFSMLVPIINQVATVRLVARGKERVQLLDGVLRALLRVDSVTTLHDGNKIVATNWTDDAGETLKTFTAAMHQETYRTTKQVALAPATTAAFDLGITSMVRVDPPLKNPHGTKRVRYQIELADGNPAEEFENCMSQSVASISDRVAEVTVTAIGPDATAADAKPASIPHANDIQPNALIQSDDPRIIKLAQEAAKDASGDWNIACALEKFVHNAIEKKNFSQAFASAAEVAQTRAGDCTEHAVLLAALLRARGIPARVAIGLVYVEPSQAFGYHMWTEAFINDHWIPLDATLGRGGIGGGHLKLLDTNLDAASAFSSFLPVAQVLGRLKIKVLEEE